MQAFEVDAILRLITSPFDQGLLAAGTKLKGFSGMLKTGAVAALGITTAALTAAGAAVVKVGKDSVETGMEFDRSMSQVYATMGDKADAILDTGQKASDALRNFAMEMGRTTQYTASESAEALNYMALAGYDATLSMQMLPNVMALASAGAFDLATASDMITDTQTAFGISVERTTQLVDEMAKAASTGNTSVEQLGNAFLTVGGLAQELNGGLITLADGTIAEVDGVQELEIALTAMANAGIKGSEAGTHMRNMLLKLSSPTSDGAAQMEALGVRVFDAEGNMRSLKDIMGELNVSLSTLTQEQKIQAISDLFNTRDLASAEALLNAVGSDWDTIGAEILNAQGAAKRMQNVQLDNLAGDITFFKSALDGAKIAISDSLTPTLREFVQFGTDGLSRLTEAFQNEGLIGAAGVFGDIIANGVKMISQKLPTLLQAGKNLVTSLVKGISSALPEFIKLLPEILNTILDLLFEVADAILTALPDIIATLAEVIPQLVKTFIVKVMENLPMIIQGLVDVVLAIVQAIPVIILGLIEALPDIIVAIVMALIESLPILIQGLIDLVLAIVEALPQIIMALIDAIPKIIDAVATTVKENGMPILQAVGEGLLNILQTIGSWFVGLLSSLGSWLAGIWNSIVTWFSNLISSIASWFVSVGESIANFFINIWNSVTGWLSNLWQGVVNFFSNIISGIANFVSNIASTVANFFVGIWQSVTSWLSNLLSNIWNFIIQIPQKIAQGFSNIWQIGRNLVTGLWNGIAGAAQWLWDKITGWVGSIWSGIKSFFGIHSPSTQFAWIGEMLDKGLAEGIDKYADVAVDSASALSEGVNDAVDVGGDLDVSSAGEGTGGASVVINVYGAQGQDIDELATIISEKIQRMINRNGAVYA